MPLFRRQYRPLNQVLISEDALIHNLEVFRGKENGKAVCPVLKSNAYGHGLIPVAKIFETRPCPYFVVDSLYEAQQLKKAGIETPLLILAHHFPENLVKKRGLTFTASSLEMLHALAEKEIPFHLELDTGMKRMGIEEDELDEAISLLKKVPKLFHGLFSHLMKADSLDESLLQMQVASFERMLGRVKDAGLNPRWIHLANSAGFLKTKVEGENMARVGLGLYGVNPYMSEDPYYKELTNLKPALRVTSTVVTVRKLQKGEALSYGGSFTAPESMQVGVIPFGYYEGLPISLSNKGIVHYQNKPCRILGRVNMNHSFIDCTGLNTHVGDEVDVFSDVSHLAELAGTIPYELLVNLSDTIRRVRVD